MHAYCPSGQRHGHRQGGSRAAMASCNVGAEAEYIWNSTWWQLPGAVGSTHRTPCIPASCRAMLHELVRQQQHMTNMQDATWSRCCQRTNQLHKVCLPFLEQGHSTSCCCKRAVRASTDTQDTTTDKCVGNKRMTTHAHSKSFHIKAQPVEHTQVVAGNTAQIC